TALRQRKTIFLLSVSEQVMSKLSFGERREGLIAIGCPRQRSLYDWTVVVKPNRASPPLVAVVEGVEKPGNLGAILRTADAAGVAAVIFADGATEPFNPYAHTGKLGV